MTASNPDLHAIKDLKALLEKATPGPWLPAKYGTLKGRDGREVNVKSLGVGLICGGDPAPTEEANAALIVAAVNLAPSLLSKAHEAEGLAKEVERLSKIAARLPNFTAALGDEIALRETAEREAEGLKAEVELWKTAAEGNHEAHCTEARLRDAAEARILQLVAENRALREALEPFARFNLDGFNTEVLEVVPSWPDNPARRIEPIWASHFRRARQAREGVAS